MEVIDMTDQYYILRGKKTGIIFQVAYNIAGHFGLVFDSARLTYEHYLGERIIPRMFVAAVNNAILSFHNKNMDIVG